MLVHNILFYIIQLSVIVDISPFVYENKFIEQIFYQVQFDPC